MDSSDDEVAQSMDSSDEDSSSDSDEAPQSMTNGAGSSDSDEEDGTEMKQPGKLRTMGQQLKAKSFGGEARMQGEEPKIPKRKNQNKPIEVSSRHRQRRVDLHNGGLSEVKPLRQKFRDPRFDDLSGRFNEDMFRANYAFVNQYKQDEIVKLRQQVKDCRDPDTKNELQRAISVLVRY
eukprot:TRINITY_DN2911_c0_g1_i3.p1 TRINITY_DN2911_c0_g1~~TRINITY_DN2911_c0_g1_i3.p1  ORF type:complete len:196 (-),score=42.10 TRINITY_DN2911_c0_g1_i3:534-1067(-)